jgi:hypothetical protein
LAPNFLVGHAQIGQIKGSYPGFASLLPEPWFKADIGREDNTINMMEINDMFFYQRTL